MRIAVTYENGSIFQHFGRTESFKVYEVEDNRIVSSRILSSGGSGHGALAGVLAENKIDVLICGGIGGGAQAALAECGITLIPGASGDADAAVEAYLRGELQPGDATCHHHDGEACCGEHCGKQGRNVGKTCRVHYRGTFNDGTQFDASYDRGEPLEFVCGAGMMIKGFDAAVADMEVGQAEDIHLMPQEAYGMPDPRAFFTVDVRQLPGAEELTVGQQVYLANEAGQPFPVRVFAREGNAITFDANHEMAGKELNFHIELLEAK